MPCSPGAFAATGQTDQHIGNGFFSFGGVEGGICGSARIGLCHLELAHGSNADAVGAVELAAVLVEERVIAQDRRAIEIAAGDFGTQLRVFAAGVAET